MMNINKKPIGKISIKRSAIPTKVNPRERTMNTHKVPTTMWRKFGPMGKKMFNTMFEQSINFQSGMTHPKQTDLPQEQWRTICWNQACHAAWSLKMI